MEMLQYPFTPGDTEFGGLSLLAWAYLLPAALRVSLHGNTAPQLCRQIPLKT